MKQRIRVVGIIRNEEGILILKRNLGRRDALVFWELPTGKIKFGEQPEEAMVRSLEEYAGLHATSVKIKDVITFLALEDSSRLSNLYIIYDVTVPDNVKPNPQDRYVSYKFIKDFASANVRLNEASTSVLEIIEGKITSDRVSARDTASAVAIYVDGASRGNPGPAGTGYRIIGVDGKLIEQGGEFIGFATSRVAEYFAMKDGIEKAIELGFKSAHFFSDSLMVVNQLNGIFSVKNPDIIPIYNDIQKLLSNFDSVSFTHIPRSENTVADSEANRAIDDLIKH
ncbi:reverse transcriptase-like protein [Candidatus Saccharibacteria bacterium]|nr:reverse transcriptase-like protein [Candidatus Saccharibacteria bacterium]